jgi:hypothetical protein
MHRWLAELLTCRELLHINHKEKNTRQGAFFAWDIYIMSPLHVSFEQPIRMQDQTPVSQFYYQHAPAELQTTHWPVPIPTTKIKRKMYADGKKKRQVAVHTSLQADFKFKT